MQIRTILKYFKIKSDNKKEVFEIYDYSKDVKQNSIFIAIGNNINKQEFIDEAIKKGANLVLSDTKNQNSYYIENLKDNLFILCKKIYGKLKIKLIGITGTNGKTTLAYFLHQKIIDSWLITTIDNIKDSTCFQRTTPTLINIYKTCKLAENHGKKYIIMEVSSIGYEEKRVSGLIFSYVILTNLGCDHLDYHHTLENYHNSKINFINSQKLASFITYKDCIKSKKIILKKKSVIDFQNIKIKTYEARTSFEYKGIKYRTNVPFEINIKNIVLMIELLKLIKRKIKTYVKLQLPKGRYEIVSSKPIIIIDYAHTIDALKELYLNIKKSYKNLEIITVIGAGGNRDKSKRDEYGRITLKNSLLTIFTNDNPRNENEKEIIDMMVSKNQGNYRIILNREKAITYGVKELDDQKLLLVIGKGHEKYQEIKGIQYPFDDREVIEKCLMN